jgi:hypothetical protein
VLKKILIITLLVLSGNAFALKWGENTTITGYYIFDDGGAFINVEQKENPDNCPGGNDYLALDTHAPNFKAMYAVVISAYARKQTVTLNYHGCLAGYPKIVSIAVPAIW